jgi:hypothetical protein
VKLSGKTWLLATIAAFLLVLNLVGEAAPEVRTLPSLPAFSPETVTKVTLSTPVEKLELDRVPGSGDTLDDAKWEIVTPLQFPADTAQIRSLLRSFSTGVNMEAYVDEGHLEDYAVDDQNGKLLEKLEKAEEVRIHPPFEHSRRSENPTSENPIAYTRRRNTSHQAVNGG